MEAILMILAVIIIFVLSCAVCALAFTSNKAVSMASKVTSHFLQKDKNNK